MTWKLEQLFYCNVLLLVSCLDNTVQILLEKKRRASVITSSRKMEALKSRNGLPQMYSWCVQILILKFRILILSNNYVIIYILHIPPDASRMIWGTTAYVTNYFWNSVGTSINTRLAIMSLICYRIIEVCWDIARSKSLWCFAFLLTCPLLTQK